jgi:hypothetical protein
MNLLDHTSIHIVPQLVLVFSDSQNTSENATGHGAEMGNVRCHILYEAEHILRKYKQILPRHQVLNLASSSSFSK